MLVDSQPRYGLCGVCVGGGHFLGFSRANLEGLEQSLLELNNKISLAQSTSEVERRAAVTEPPLLETSNFEEGGSHC